MAAEHDRLVDKSISADGSAAPYEVKLEVYEGPLDLLLHLITRQRVDIYEVSIATITDDYLGALERMDGVDLEVATGFLVIAATLLELKSSRLLPRPHAEEGSLLEERDLLLARLVECSTFRDAGSYLAAALARGEDLHPREVPLEPPYAALVPDPLAGVALADLARAAAVALAPTAPPSLDTSHVTPITATVRDALVAIAPHLEGGAPVGFAALTHGCSRMEVIVRFLALLELYKAGAVDLRQEDRFGEIEATWTGAVTLGEALDGVDEYAVAAPAGGGRTTR